MLLFPHHTGSRHNPPKGRATRAIERAVKEPGMLPAGPLSIIKEFVTGKR